MEQPISVWKRIGRSMLLLVAGGLLALFGAGLLVADPSETARASASWPSVPGRIISSKHTTSRSTGGSSRRLTQNAEIRYSYTVARKAYRGKRIRFGNAPGGYQVGAKESAKAAVARYPAGATVKVYYSPDDPNEAVLEPGAAGVPAFGASAIGTIALFGGLALLLLVGGCRIASVISGTKRSTEP